MNQSPQGHPIDVYRTKIIQGFLAGLLTGLIFSLILGSLTPVPGGGLLAAPVLLLGGDFWHRKPFTASFALGCVVGGLLHLGGIGYKTYF